MGVLGAGYAQALIVNVSGQEWDVSTFQGGYYENYGKFETIANGGVMPWWDSQSTAGAFTAAVNTALGLPWKTINGDMGPFFAFSFNPGLRREGITLISPSISLAYLSPPISNGITCPDYPVCVQISYAAVSGGAWAQATAYNSIAPVPGALSALGAVAAFRLSRHLRKRIDRSIKAEKTSRP